MKLLKSCKAILMRLILDKHNKKYVENALMKLVPEINSVHIAKNERTLFHTETMFRCGFLKTRDRDMPKIVQCEFNQTYISSFNELLNSYLALDLRHISQLT